MGSFTNFAPEIITKMEYVLKAMINHAISMGINAGEASITISHKDMNGYKLTMSRINNTQVRIGAPEKPDVNYGGVAAMKTAQMQRTGKPSGRDDGLIGEVPYRGGGLLEKYGYTVWISYSGGTEDEDVQIMEYGIDIMNDFIQ